MVTDPVRRAILSVLADEGTVTRTDLVAHLATDADIPTSNTDSLEIALHHSHLPRLADENYIEYDARSGDIVLWQDRASIRAQLNEE
jgi:hypothetical protein